MKATLFAVLLSLFVVSFPSQAVTDPLPLPTEQKAIKVNINKADAQTLATSCKGIGKKRAEAIVKYREMHGNFRSVDELAQVAGIGKQFVKRHQTQLQTIFAVE